MAYEFENITVLVIEKTRAMYELTKAVLNGFGVNRVYGAYGFQEGFDAFCKHNPDLIIIDWLEDPLNGLELTKKIRSDPTSPNPFVPVILMTGYSLKKRVLRARDSGVSSFMTKPYTAKMLYQRIEQLVERPRHFIKSDNYFGHDRRVVHNQEYTGPERRSEEPTATDHSKNRREKD